MSNVFTDIMVKKPATASFDHSHDVKTSFNMGELVPITHTEVLPGDKWTMRNENLLRFLPLIAPVMHKVNVTLDYFFVANRLLWSNWEKFITNSEDVLAPFINLPNISIGDKGDYFGLPIGYLTEGNPIPISPMIQAAYDKVFDEYYRDQNLVDEEFVPLIDGDNTEIYSPKFASKCLRRAWMHDYFTSCLPFAQKGDSVTLPLTQEMEVPVEVLPDKYGGSTRPVYSDWNTGLPDTNADAMRSSNANIYKAGPGSPSLESYFYDPRGSMTVDINSEAVDINSLRVAFRLQEWLEKNARGGTRYVEMIWQHFHQKSSDARLQRPEWIGRSRQNMVISEVLSTAQTETEMGNTPVGNMAGHAISAGASKYYSYRAEEHGYIICILNVQPTTSYLSQGVHRSFTRFTNLDYAWPTFAHIGEQEVKTKEIYVSPLANPEETFGYIPRYSEYRYTNSKTTGDLRDTLEYWTLGRKFASQPVLNKEFITANPPNWIFAFEDEEEDFRHIIVHSIHHWKVRRRLPKYGVPTI